MKWYDEEVWAWLMAIAFLLLFAHLMQSCKTKYVTVEVPKTHYVTRHTTDSVRDSIYVHDSTFVWMKGDTLYHDRWHKEVINSTKVLNKHDSIHDSIAVPVYISKEVEKKLSWWQRAAQNTGIAVWITAVLAVVVLWYKRRC